MFFVKSEKYLNVLFWKDKKEFTRDMMKIYNAHQKHSEITLNNFDIKWNAKKSNVIKSWLSNGD